MKLPALLDSLRGEMPPGPVQLEMQLNDLVPPQLQARLSKLDRMGLLTGDVLMSLVMQAPIDPLGLAELLMMQSIGWTFSSVDCSIVRVLVRSPDKSVAAAVRVDLLDNSVEALALNKAQQLTPFKRLDLMGMAEHKKPGDWILTAVQTLCDDAIFAAGREASLP